MRPTERPNRLLNPTHPPVEHACAYTRVSPPPKRSCCKAARSARLHNILQRLRLFVRQTHCASDRYSVWSVCALQSGLFAFCVCDNSVGKTEHYNSAPYKTTLCYPNPEFVSTGLIITLQPGVIAAVCCVRAACLRASVGTRVAEFVCPCARNEN